MLSRSLVLIMLLTVSLASFHPVFAEDSAVSLGDREGVADIVRGQTGKNVELRLKSGDKIAGTVVKVTEKAVHISRISGAEFYDAVVDISEISAVVVRARQSLK